MKPTISPSTYVQTRSIGGSDAAAVMGLSRYKTPAEVYDAITGHSGPRPHEHDRGPTERGRALESWIIQLYERETGFTTKPQPKTYSEQHPFLHASPDRVVDPMVTDSHKFIGPGVLEIKAPGTYVLQQWKEEGIPQEYYIQIQHYLFVLGYQWAHFCALDYDKFEPWIVPVERDEQTIAMIVDRCTTFWLDYVEQGIRPPDTGPLIQEVTWPKGRPGAPKKRTDDAWIQAEHALAKAVTEQKLATQALEMAKTRVKELMGEDEEITGAELRVSWKESTHKSFDLTAFMEARALTTEDVEPFYRRKATRPFNIYPAKEPKP
jgi:putative phage-type endonuclease